MRDTCEKLLNCRTETSSAIGLAPRSVVHRMDESDPCTRCFQSRSCFQAALLQDEGGDHRVRQTAAVRLRKGQRLFAAGRTLDRVYAIRTGSFKSVMRAPDGRQQVLGFHFSGDMIGLDGYAAQVYLCDAVAVEASEACEIDARALDAAARARPIVQRRIQALVADSMRRAQQNLLVLGSMQGAERLAHFLLDLSDRHRGLGLSSREFALRMTRKDIGSYLGMYSETVSRLFARFENAGLIQMTRRHQVQIPDRTALAALLGRQSASLRIVGASPVAAD